MPRIVAMSARMNSLRTAAKSKANKTPADTLAEVIKMLGANAEKVEIGKGMALPVPKDVKPKSYLAQVRGKLMSVTRAGQPWAGRQFVTAYDEKTNEVCFERIEDTKTPPPALQGRKKGSKNGDAKAHKESMDKAKAHLGGGEGGKSGDDTTIKDLTKQA